MRLVRMLLYRGYIKALLFIHIHSREQPSITVPHNRSHTDYIALVSFYDFEYRGFNKTLCF
jgi:hypothetical protein